MTTMELLGWVVLISAPLSVILIAVISRINKDDIDDGPPTIIVPPVNDRHDGDMPDDLDNLGTTTANLGE